MEWIVQRCAGLDGHKSSVTACVRIRGIPTVTLAMENGVQAPRLAFVPFPYNFPMGEPNDAKRHEEVARAALVLLHELRGPGEVELPFRWET